MITFQQIVSVEKNSFNDTYSARILYDIDGIDECRFLKFFGQPTNQQVLDEVDKYVTRENTPKSVEIIEQELLLKQQELLRVQEEVTKKEEELDEAKTK